MTYVQTYLIAIGHQKMKEGRKLTLPAFFLAEMCFRLAELVLWV
jgi:hypothetical protein